MKNLALLIAGAASVALVSAPSFAKDVTFSVSHWVPPRHPIASKSIVPWTQSITKASGGSIKFKIYPAGQLGKPIDHYDMARDGIADITWLNPGFSANRFPVFAAVSLPMTVSNGRGGIAALNDWYREYAAKEMGDVKFCLAHMLAPLIFHTTKRILRPTDLKGLKIRPSSAMEAMYIRNFGGATVPGPNPQAREMISRGVIDGTTGVVASNIIFGVTKVAKYHLNVPFSAVSFVYVINKRRYDALTKEQKAVIDDHCNTKAAVKFFTAPQAFEESGMAKLAAMKDGREIIQPNASVLAEWKAGTAAVQKAWEKEVKAKGYNASEILAKLRKALRAQDALVK